MKRYNSNKIKHDNNQEPIVVSKIVTDLLLKEERPMELMGLYWFYLQTAKWQKTNQIKCTVNYAATGLKVGVDRIRKLKKVLVSLGLVEDIQSKNDTGQITGWYMRVNYIWTKEQIERYTTLQEIPPSAKPTLWETPHCGKPHTVGNSQGNALSTNKGNALSTNKGNALSTNNITPPPSTEVDTDSKKPSPKDKSILDEKQKQKARQLKRYERLSETLYNHVQESKNIKLPKTRIKSWAEDMVKLENINGIDYYRQKEALDWYINHYQEEYMPIIQSGAAFRGKFIKIEDARNRIAQARKKKSGNTIGHLSPEPIDYGPVARWDEETQTIIPSGKFAQKPNN